MSPDEELGTLHLLPVVKRKKEVLFKLLRLEEMKPELDRSRQQLD